MLAGCASSSVGALRFKNEPAVWRVADRNDIAKPARRPLPMMLYFMDVFAARRLDRALAIPVAQRAADVNALDEVPDSTWFTNRLGVRDMSLDEIRRGGSAEVAPTGPWRVLGTKVGGKSPGFLVTDANNNRFLMKFDAAGSPEMETGADVVVQKILWTLGYNTPEDTIEVVRRDELALASNAKIEDVFGHKQPMTTADLDRALEGIDRRADGSYRVLVSRFLAGTPLGGYAVEGVRADDPNDRIAHEHRRSIRAQSVFFAWLDHTDIKEDNSLDMWVTDGPLHYVRHYLVDFGNALGVMGWGQATPSDGYAEMVDLKLAGMSLVTLGLWRRPWEFADGERIRGVGRFESAHFDPFGWSDRYPYEPFERSDDTDGLWAAKTMMRFTPAQLRAAVEQGKYSDPRAVDYLVKILVERQRKTAHAWFERVAPLDGFRIVGGDTLCFDDLLLRYFTDDRVTTYRARAFDFAGQPTGWHADRAGNANACFSQVPAAADHDGYVIIELAVRRGGSRLAPIYVHVARDPSTQQLRVIGIRRT
jgi:hypothetical protein